ncbi:PleD family two-component system response regulator [Rhodanobacter umsongensis]|uniref:PleD family two-component system response regulator n=1 Tax=Rhodanobacter umsongensis TaxID=633153 RepID=A0ABW0JHW7_9GAMM
MAGIAFIKRLLGGADGEQAAVQYAQAALGSRVLVVDDSPTICAVLGKMLGIEGYLVSRANDGDNAIQLARDEQPALIFLDIVLPGMNGFAVLRALRHDPLTRHIPIVMISGNQQATEQFYVQRFGADDFMKKPFGRDEVCKRIGQLVQSGRLAARKPSEPVSVPVAGLSAEALDAIPDIAMPYADETREPSPPPRPRPGLQMAHGMF